jgi:hypothetical protein
MKCKHLEIKYINKRFVLLENIFLIKMLQMVSIASDPIKCANLIDTKMYSVILLNVVVIVQFSIVEERGCHVTP